MRVEGNIVWMFKETYYEYWRRHSMSVEGDMVWVFKET